MVKRGNPWKPVLEKAYVAVYVFTIVKALHLELVLRLKTDAFLASFRSFGNQRGLPTNVFSDNGRNFVGAQNELQTASIPVMPNLRSRVSASLATFIGISFLYGLLTMEDFGSSNFMIRCGSNKTLERTII